MMREEKQPNKVTEWEANQMKHKAEVKEKD